VGKVLQNLGVNAMKKNAINRGLYSFYLYLYLCIYLSL
jgi:hypothetical protein